MNEQTLTALFDLQHFAQNPRVARLIAETEGRYSGVSLSEEDLDEVWAAGGLPPVPNKQGRDDHD